MYLPILHNTLSFHTRLLGRSDVIIGNKYLLYTYALEFRSLGVPHTYCQLQKRNKSALLRLITASANALRHFEIVSHDMVQELRGTQLRPDAAAPGDVGVLTKRNL